MHAVAGGHFERTSTTSSFKNLFLACKSCTCWVERTRMLRTSGSGQLILVVYHLFRVISVACASYSCSRDLIGLASRTQKSLNFTNQIVSCQYDRVGTHVILFKEMSCSTARAHRPTRASSLFPLSHHLSA